MPASKKKSKVNPDRVFKDLPAGTSPMGGSTDGGGDVLPAAIAAKLQAASSQRFQAMLSNVIKSSGDSQSAIIGNLKG